MIMSKQQSQRFLIAARVSALWFIALVFTIIGGLLSALRVSEMLFAVGIVLWLGVTLVLLLILLLCKSPACRRFVFWDMRRPPGGWHKDASQFGRLADGPVAVVADIIVRQTRGKNGRKRNCSI